jgi:hypothetical protein
MYNPGIQQKRSAGFPVPASTVVLNSSRSPFSIASKSRSVEKNVPTGWHNLKSQIAHFMKNIVTLAFIALSILFTAIPLLAQPGLPSNPAQAPLDGGLTVAAIAGGMLALRKLKRK